MPALYERILCSGSYAPIGESINKRIMAYRKEQNKGAFSSDELEDNLAFAYFSSNSIILYRQWVADGKRMPLEDLIGSATKLICCGLFEYVKK